MNERIFDENIRVSYSESVPKEDFEFHIHDLYEIYFLIDGRVDYFVEKEVYRLQNGDVLVMRSDEIHKASIKNKNKYNRYVIHFNPLIINQIINMNNDFLDMYEKRNIGKGNLIRLNINEKSKLESLFKNYMICENESESVHYSVEEKTIIFLEILLLLNKVYSGQKSKISYSAFEPKVTKVLNYIDKNLQKELKINSLAKEVYISPQHLNRLFKKHTGTSVHKFIIYKRLQRAKTYLKEGKSVQESCILSGFNDYSNFIRMFKKKTGISPGKYKNSNL